MSEHTVNTTHAYEPEFGDYVELLKPRVMSLVVFTALVGMLAAPHNLHIVEIIASVIFIAVGAGASGALNMWWDADVDAIMTRTAKRPVPSGRLDGQDALCVGVALSAFSVIMLALSANILAAALLAFTIFFYAVIYTMWLKRSTPQNIVIGGAAGAFPPMIGWIAATGSISIEAVLMFALIFMWTPPHFWVLALFTRSDYSNANIPMLTVTHGHTSTRRHILVYSILLALISLGIGFTSLGGIIYMGVAIVCNIIMLKDALIILKRDTTSVSASEFESGQDDHYSVEKRFFKFSIVYLFAHFLAILIQAYMPDFWLNFGPVTWFHSWPHFW